MSQRECIVVGVDGSDGSSHAVGVAARLAKALQGEVVAVHAFEPLALLGEVSPPVDFAALREQSHAELDGPWVQPLRDAGVPFRTLLIEERPTEALKRAVQLEDATHLVIGTRGRGGLKGALLGSVAQAMPAAVHVPVTIVPPGAE